MQRWNWVGCAIGLMVLLGGCAQQPPPTPDTRAADEKAIRDRETSWNADWASKDVDKVASNYADDATLMVPGAPIMKGKEAIHAGLKDVLADPNISLKFSASSVTVSKGGDIGYSQGTYTMTMSDAKTKKPTTEVGKYVTVYQKQADGSWKAVEDINNADPPPPPPAKK